VLAFLIAFFVLSIVFPGPVLAHCPLCIVGAGAGLSISRFLGIDDAVTGVWLAAFIGAFSLWLARFVKRKFIPLQEELIYILSFGLTLWSFYAFNLVDEHAGLLFGVPRLVFGIVAGAVIFYLTDVAHQLVKKVKGKVLIPYQGVIFSLGGIAILSLVVFALVTCSFY